VLHPTLHVLVPRSRRQEKQGEQRQKDEREAAKAPRKRGGHGERDGRGARTRTHTKPQKHTSWKTCNCRTASSYCYTRQSSLRIRIQYITYVGLLPLTVIHINLLYVLEYHTLRILIFLHMLKSQKILFLKNSFK
jgi:hypothetical protein